MPLPHIVPLLHNPMFWAALSIKNKYNALKLRMSNQKSYRTFAATILLTVGGLALPAFAQVGTVDRADEIRRALQRADYQLAADLADSAIAHFDDYSPEKLAEIHALRAFVAAEKNATALVDAHFLAALQLDPGHQLDPVFFSPALQQRFEKIRATLPTREAPVRVETRYVMVSDPRVAAAWKSLLLPGWGQRFKGQKSKGTIFTVASATLAGATLASHFLRRSAERDYLAAGEQDVVDKYDTFNRYHLLRKNLALGLGLVWGAAVLDALIFKPHTQAVAVGLRSDEENLTLLVTFSF